MMSSTIIFLWLASVPVAQIDAEQDAIDAVVESSRILISAKQIERTAPKYPQFELRKGNQAWVRIAYCIDESGLTQNVSVLDSVGSVSFDKAAIETVKRWKFEPALIDGEPSWQSRNQTLISFAIEEENTGATRRFASQFRKIGKLLDQNDLEAADKLFWHVYESYNLSLYELSKLWAQRVRHESLSGDMSMLDMALHRATASKGQWIEKEGYIRLLELRVRVELKIGQYHAAMRAYRELVKATGEDAEEVLVLKPTMKKLRDMIKGDQILKMRKSEPKTNVTSAMTAGPSLQFAMILASRISQELWSPSKCVVITNDSSRLFPTRLNGIYLRVGAPAMYRSTASPARPSMC